MRARLLCAIALTAAATVSAAQTTTSTPQPANDEKARPQSMTVSGCVATDPAKQGHYTLADVTTGMPTYRLSGSDLSRYLGRRVELIGAMAPSKIAIVGGLVPSPNVAAQAGALDPTRAAMANLGAEGNTKPGNIEVPELRVKTVKPASGACLGVDKK
jgi:hypothetical protein